MVAMWRSGLFPRTLCAIGSLATAACAGAALLTDPETVEAQDALSSAFPLLVVRALWTGILLVRRRPRQ